MSVQPTYYARDGVVRKSPIRVEKPEGGAVITMGFPVCTMHAIVGDSAADTVAALMNAGEFILEAKPLTGDETDVSALVKYGQTLEARNTKLLEALKEIENGLRNTGTFKGEWMTRITKPQAYEIARAAIAAVEGVS